MNYTSYLKDNQEVVYKILKHSLERNKFFHASLLTGQSGTPLLELAYFFAKSLLCENRNPFACCECNTCKRIDDQNYTDLIVIDGKENSIRKEDILNIEYEFSKSSQESKNIKVYIINHAEKMKPDAANALLKFLEEPEENTYAILTTENEFRILPTILSRLEIFRFDLLDKNDLITESVNLGVAQEDAELLSNFYNDPKTIKEKCDDKFIKYKSVCLDIIKTISNTKSTRFVIADELLPLLLTKENAEFMLDLFIFFFKESYSYLFKNSTIYSSYVNIFKLIGQNISSLDECVLELMNARNELYYNLNMNLLFLSVLSKIFGVKL